MIQKQIHPVGLHPEQMQIIQEIRDSSADTNGSSISETPSYTDPSASEFGDGQDNNSFNSGDNNDTPQLSPTPTPVLDDHTSCFDPYYKKGDPNFTDGNEPFYQKLNGESIPFTGTGKKDDPYVFLCSSAKGKVTVTGSFFNKLAGYGPDGTRSFMKADTGISWNSMKMIRLQIMRTERNPVQDII